MASGTRGYSSYRGRGRKGKIFLAILLILIILGSVGFIMAREHMRYDADGNLHFDLPWDKGTSDPVEAPGDPDVVIREPEQTDVKTPVRGRLLAAKPLTMEDQETAETPLSEAAVTAVTLKDSAGRVYFDSSAAVTGAVSVKPDTGEALNGLDGPDRRDRCGPDRLLPRSQGRQRRRRGHGPEEHRRLYLL